MQKEKLDFLIAIGEKLCNLEENEDSRRLDQNNTCVFIEPPTHWDEIPEDFATTASQIVRTFSSFPEKV